MNWNGVDINDNLSAEFCREQEQLKQAFIERSRTAKPNPVENMTAEQIREAYERSAAEKQVEESKMAQYNAARTFTAECETYVQTPTNAKRIADWLEAAGRTGTSVDDYHDAFTALSTAGLLRIKPTAPKPRSRFSEAELYNMPIDELERLAARGEL